MKFYESNFSYDYSFPTVTLAYFLRYPNPYSKHVLSADVIDRFVDPDTQRLHTTRLVLKRSKVPSAMLRILPSGLAGPNGASQTYVVETSVVDVKEGWMKTQSKNMEWTGVLSVVEDQHYQRQAPSKGVRTEPLGSFIDDFHEKVRVRDHHNEWTSCNTVVTFVSRIGQGKIAKRKDSPIDVEGPRGFFASWSTNGIQRTIEHIGVRRTKDAVVNGKNGMNMVLERLRNGGIVAALEGMRRDREAGLVPT